MKRITALTLGVACACALFVGVGSAAAATGHNFTATATSNPQQPLAQRPGFRFDGNPALIMCQTFTFGGNTATSVATFGSSNCWANPQLPSFTITKRAGSTTWPIGSGPTIENIALHVTSLHYCEFDITGKIVATTQSETATGATWLIPPALNKDAVVVSNVKERCEPLFGIRNGEKGEFFAERGVQVKYTS